MKMNIVTTSSFEYVYYNKVMLLSLFENNKEHTFDVYYGYIDDRAESLITDMESMAEKYNSRIIPIKISIDDVLDENDITKSIVYMRHIVYWLLPESVKKCMTLSSDMLILGDIEDFYCLELEGKTVGGTVYFDQTDKDVIKERYKYSIWNQKRGLPIVDSPLFNSELLIIDIEVLKAKYNYRDYLNLLLTKELPNSDEQALNTIFRNDKKTIGSYSYGVWSMDVNDISDLENVKVLHYGGAKEKPWESSTKNQIVGIWWEYAKKIDEYSILVAKEQAYQAGKKRADTWKAKYDTLNKLFKFIQNEDESKLKKFKKVVLYGNGYIGQYFKQKLEQNDVKIMCVIDRSDNNEYSMPLYQFIQRKEEYKEADAVIITVPQNVEEIKQKIESQCDIKVLSIDEVLSK